MQRADKLNISLIQYNIVWEDKQKNLTYIREILVKLSGKTDIAVLPEMCTTGFTMNVQNLAETNDGTTITRLKQWATEFNIAICGSFIALENKEYYNRAFFITPDTTQFYDKHHLFRMGVESEYFSAGKKRLIFEHKGFNICLLICYDLRFPVWSRNVDNEYDILIYVANWPQARAKVWDSLLIARAIENMAYVCGVNRIGTDGNNLVYDGRSKIINPKGDEIASAQANQEEYKTIEISKTDLDQFRDKFPVWKDADKFNLK